LGKVRVIKKDQFTSKFLKGVSGDSLEEKEHRHGERIGGTLGRNFFYYFCEEVPLPPRLREKGGGWLDPSRKKEVGRILTEILYVAAPFSTGR